MRMKSVSKVLLITWLLVCTIACSGKTKYTLEMAQNYLTEGRYEEAIVAYTALIEIDPSDTGLYMQRADAYVYTEQYQNAIQDYSTVIERDPENADAYLFRGVIRFINSENEAGDADIKAMRGLLTEEEMQSTYEALVSYLTRHGITESQKEENGTYTAHVYPLPNGGYLVLIQLGDTSFGIEFVPPGGELPSLTAEDALYYFDWYTPSFMWWDSSMGDNWYMGPARFHFHRDDTADLYLGDEVKHLNMYYGVRAEGEYLIDYNRPGMYDPSHYMIYDTSGTTYCVWVGDTVAADEGLFVPVIPE